MAGVLHGVASSAAGVTSAASRNLAVLTFDEDYGAGRERRLRAQAEARTEASETGGRAQEVVAGRGWGGVGGRAGVGVMRVVCLKHYLFSSERTQRHGPT